MIRSLIKLHEHDWVYSVSEETNERLRLCMLCGRREFKLFCIPLLPHATPNPWRRIHE